jgi:hypothetical protein
MLFIYLFIMFDPDWDLVSPEFIDDGDYAYIYHTTDLECDHVGYVTAGPFMHKPSTPR